MENIGLMIPPSLPKAKRSTKRGGKRGGQAQAGGFLPLLLAGLAGSVLPKLLGGKKKRSRRTVRK